eukprot:scaffold34893_cov66-Skeletonema_marinoi.AAC.1
MSTLAASKALHADSKPPPLPSRIFHVPIEKVPLASEGVDCHIHSVRYDIVLESRAGDRLRCLIRSPTTL